jgi:hypothetical protein
MFGQFSYGLRITASPSVDPGTNSIIANRSLANESLLNITNVTYSGQIGLMSRLEKKQFWLMSELLYGRSTTQFSMHYTNESDITQTPSILSEKRSYLDLPVSIGVSLGAIEVFSGFTLSYDLGYNSALKEVANFRSSIPSMHYGWHSGVGVNLGHILVDIRYAQQFGNYGEGHYINDKELLLKNSPGRIVASVGYRI